MTFQTKNDGYLRKYNRQLMYAFNDKSGDYYLPIGKMSYSFMDMDVTHGHDAIPDLSYTTSEVLVTKMLGLKWVWLVNFKALL